ncbi:MAG: lysylphosphatidylglycerol synthase transmembrane domain-containing protein [Kiritimatiellia bacterium]
MSILTGQSVKKTFRLAVAFAISIMCLYFAFRGVPFKELGSHLSGGKYWWLIPALLLQVLGIMARAQRWIVLLNAKGCLVRAFWSQCVGYLFTNILPFRMGEPARVIALSRACRLPLVQVAATAIVERLMDAASCLLALLVILPLLSLPPMVAAGARIMAVLCVAGFAGLLVLAHFPAWSERLMAWIAPRVRLFSPDTLLARWHELLDGVMALKTPKAFFSAAFWSFATWLCSFLTAWVCILVFVPDGSFVEGVFIIVALSVAVSVPSSPGFIGIYQLAGQQALVLPFAGKYDDASALTITLALHLMYYAPTTLLGVAALWKLNLSRKKLAAEARAAGRP